jgi:hypothetical protein
MIKYNTLVYYEKGGDMGDKILSQIKTFSAICEPEFIADR